MEHNKINPSYILIAVFILLYLYLNIDIPFVIDDWVYSRSFVGVSTPADDTDPNRLIDSFSEFCSSSWTHYNAITGRVILIFAQEIFCALADKWVYDILLAIAFPVMLFMIARGTNPSAHESYRELSCIACVSLFFVFCEPSTFYNGVSVTINYVFPTIVNLGFLLLYNKWQNNITRKRFWILIATAAFAALWHENFSVPIACGLFLITVLHWKETSREMKLVCLTYIIFSSVVIFAPANIQRFTLNTDESRKAYSSSLIFHLTIFKNLRITFIYFLLLAILTYKRKTTWMKSHIRENAQTLIFLGVSILFSLMIGAVNGRVLYASEIFSLMLLCNLLIGTQIYKRHCRLLSTTCWTLCCALMVFLIVEEQPYLKNFYNAKHQAEISQTDNCIITVEPQDSLPPQIEKYFVATLNPFQVDLFRWKNHKKSVVLQVSNK